MPAKYASKIYQQDVQARYASKICQPNKTICQEVFCQDASAAQLNRSSLDLGIHKEINVCWSLP